MVSSLACKRKICWTESLYVASEQLEQPDTYFLTLPESLLGFSTLVQGPLLSALKCCVSVGCVVRPQGTKTASIVLAL